MNWFWLVLFIPSSALSAMRFDGTDDVVHLQPSTTVFNYTNEISVSFWLKKEAGLGSAAEYVGKGRLFNGNNSHWQMRNNSGKYDFYFASPSATFRIFSTSSTFTATNVWNHIGFRYRWGVSNSATFYINGLSVAGVWTLNPGNNLAVTNVEPYRVGATYAGSTVRGELAEVAVWNAYLNDDEMYTLSASRQIGTPLEIRRNPDQLTVYWPMADESPFWTTASGTNRVQDPRIDKRSNSGTALNSPQARPGPLSAP